MHDHLGGVVVLGAADLQLQLLLDDVDAGHDLAREVRVVDAVVDDAVGRPPHGDGGDPVGLGEASDVVLDVPVDTRLPDGKIGPLPFLGLRRGGGRGGAIQGKEGSHFAANCIGAIVLQARTAIRKTI